MAEVILICGKLCSGKTTYAKQLTDRDGIILLSIDELMLTMFGGDAGAEHDSLAEKARRYLLQKSVECLRADISVVLDWGFWTRADRKNIVSFFVDQGFVCRTVYLDVPDDVWQSRIQKRNAQVEVGAIAAYYVDDGLARKFADRFEKPDRSEVDTWIEG